MAVKGGIKVDQLHPSLVARLLADLGEGVAANEAQQAMIGTRPGVRAMNVLAVGANVANGDTLVIGAHGEVDEQTFEVDIINTDSGVNTADSAAGALLDAGTVALVTLGAAPATAINPGDVIRIENELLLCLRSLSTTQKVCARAYGGSVRAAHAQNLDVFVSDSVPPANVSVPLVTTLTPAAYAVALIAVFNWTPPTSESAPARTTSQDGSYTAVPTVGLGAGAQIVFLADEAGEDDTATTEEFSNSTDNVWANATMVGGKDPGVAASESSVRAVTATEELLGEMHFAFPFIPSAAIVFVRTSAGAVKLFTGTVLIGYVESTDATMPSNTVTLRAVGAASTAYATILAAGDVVTVLAFE